MSHNLIEVGLQELSSETLDAVIESFVLREGTNYGADEVSMDAKCRQVKSQLESGKAKLVFDPETESVTLITDREFRALQTKS